MPTGGIFSTVCKEFVENKGCLDTDQGEPWEVNRSEVFYLKYDAGYYDVVVIGAGHAGIEAALAAARLGCTCLLYTSLPRLV